MCCCIMSSGGLSGGGLAATARTTRKVRPMTTPPGRVHRPHLHRRAVDHLPSDTAADRFNKWLAVKITSGVGTMWCAYVFAGISLSSLPSTLALHSVNSDVQWVAQTFLQLVLLSVIIVGQNIQSAASDARSLGTFNDTETIIDRLDTDTQGGLTTVLAEVKALRAEVKALRART